MNPTSLHTSLSCANIPQRCRIDSIIQTRFASTISIFTRGSASNMHQCTIATASNSDKLVWIQTESRDVVTAGLESGFTSFLARSSASNPDSQNQWDQWKRLGQLDLITELPDGSLVDETGAVLGRLCRLASAADLSAAEAAGAEPGYTVTDSTDWQIIPAENLVAAFQALPGTLLAVAADATACRVMLEALEVGTDGVVLATESPADVRQLVQYLQQRKATASGCLQYQAVQVVTVRPVGMGDRACVDLAEAMTPGEGLLVGSFARGLFWVHSECGTSVYINSRPFRVNAGPVHAYVQAPGGRTQYLSELKSGDEVVVADAAGRQRTALVGRVKIERRPLVLVEACGPDGVKHSILLQNAETVKLVGPSKKKEGTENSGPGGHGAAWRVVAVSDLSPGDEVFVLVQGGARHTGVSIEESIVER